MHIMYCSSTIMTLHSRTEKCIGDNVSISYCHLKSGKKFPCSLQMSQRSYDILTLSPEERVLWAVCAACIILLAFIHHADLCNCVSIIRLDIVKSNHSSIKSTRIFFTWDSLNFTCLNDQFSLSSV